MLKRSYFLGLTAGILSGIVSIIYQKAYNSALGADFSAVVKPIALLSACVIGCVVAATGHWLLNKWLKSNTEIVFNLLFTILSLATFIGPFTAKLPLDMATPELFPGLTVPMHLFPVLAWMTLRPLFIKNYETPQKFF